MASPRRCRIQRIPHNGSIRSVTLKCDSRPDRRTIVMARVPYSHELYALARHLVFRCEKEHKSAVECKKSHDWPEDCKPESEALVRATNKL